MYLPLNSMHLHAINGVFEIFILYKKYHFKASNKNIFACNAPINAKQTMTL